MFTLGVPAIYYSCMTALVPDDRVGAATAGGQLTLNIGGLVAPPAFGYLVDTAGYATGWYALGTCTLVAALFVGRLAVSPRLR
ncbi:hypothetical protein ACFQJD_10755 [Haloplanus sp. GCM10025708]|uniref:hypothetical protein n=1 Tax=Haloplanus sp. GCM10025708 TaxID=3252679 RepID=UPI00362139E5